MSTHHTAWNKGRLLGQKPPFKPKEIWSLRIRLQLTGNVRDLALFNLAIDRDLGADRDLGPFGIRQKCGWSTTILDKSRSPRWRPITECSRPHWQT